MQASNDSELNKINFHIIPIVTSTGREINLSSDILLHKGWIHNADCTANNILDDSMSRKGRAGGKVSTGEDIRFCISWIKIRSQKVFVDVVVVIILICLLFCSIFFVVTLFICFNIIMIVVINSYYNNRIH